MKKYYHREITTHALHAYFSQDALEHVIVANLGQDALQYQIGHDHFHYDANSFAVADAYCAQLRQDVRSALKRKTADQARTFLAALRIQHRIFTLTAIMLPCGGKATPMQRRRILIRNWMS